MIVPFAVGAAVLAAVVALDRVAHKAVRPVPRVGTGVPDGDGVEVESVRLDSGGSDLAGWILRPAEVSEAFRDQGPVVVLTHGWGRCRRYVLPVGHALVRRGFTVVMFDVRSHGENVQERYLTARQYSDDVGEIARFSRSRFASRQLALVGHSMGAAGSVVAAAEGAPADGLALIACPADVLEVTANYMDEQGLPGRILTTVLRPFWWPRVRGGFHRLAPERRLREVDVPVLIVHPSDDTRVTRDQADRLAAATRSGVSVVEGAGHSEVLHRSELIDLLVSFLEELPTHGGDEILHL